VQATLLGVAIAVILALGSALVGPLFIDWSQYRAVFESEATRIFGLPVHVTGTIDARILPTPSLALRGIQVGAGEQRAEARELDIEFALGPLMRGVFRAADMRLVGPQLRLGLSADGRIGAPSGQAGIDPDQLSIDRLTIEDGRATLADARSGTGLVLEKFWFTGEMRSLAGPVKGDGGFSTNGESYGYRLTAGRASEDGSIKVRVTLDPPSHGLTLEADGAARFDAATPGFEGTLTIARPAGIAAEKGRGVAVAPWRATGRVKATAASALFEQVEFQYGPEERAIKLGGIADIRFGKSPRLNGVLSAREIDLDRALDLSEAVKRQPIAAIRAVLDSFSGTLQIPLPVQLGIGIDSATLAGGTVQAVRGDFKSDGAGLDIETLEFRAPGVTQVRLSGRLQPSGKDTSFSGPAAVETSDPQALAAWLEGRPATRGQAGSLRASGQVNLAPEHVAVDRLKGEIDRKPFEGRVLYAWAANNAAPRLEADLKAADLDIDRIIAVGRTVFAATPDLPGETVLSLEIGHATMAEVDVKTVTAKLRFDKTGLNVERLAIGDVGGAAIDLSGHIEAPLSSPHGAIALDLDARNLDGALTLVAKVAPESAQTMRALAPRLTPLKTHATVTLGERGSEVNKFAIEGAAGALRLRFAAEAKGDLSDASALDLRLDGNVASDDGPALLQLFGLDAAVAVGSGPGRLNLSARGPLGREIRIEARLAATGVSVAADGAAHLFGDQAPNATFQVTAAVDDLRGLRPANPAQPKLPATAKARLTAKSDSLSFDDFTATLAGVPMHGRIEAALAVPLRIDGQLDVETFNVASLIGASIGAPTTGPAAASPSAEPFGAGLLGKAIGRLQLGTARAVLSPTLALRQAKANVRLGERELALEDIDGELAGGRLAGEASFRRSDDGIASHLRLALGDADVAALIPSSGRPAPRGRATLQIETDGTGLSPVTLLGSLTGGGSVTVTNGEIAGLDPKAFEAVMRAADQTSAIDAPKLKQVMETALDRGAFKFAHADGAVTVSNGQARLGTTIVHGEGADLGIAASLDLADRNMDARLALVGAPVEGTSGRPEVQATVKGPLGTARRTIDVTALSAWLTLRAIERETRRIDAIESERRDAMGSIEPPQPVPPPPAAVRPPAPAPRVAPAEPSSPRPAQPPSRPEASVAPALPPPIDIRPAPGSSTSTAKPRVPATPNGAALKREKEAGPAETAPPPSKSILERLFGSH